MEYSSLTNMHAAAEETAALPRMRGVVAPHRGLPRRTTMEEASGLQRLRGTVTLSLKPPEEPAVVLPLKETAEEPATAPVRREAVQLRAKAPASEGCLAIADMAARLGISPGVRAQAQEVFRRMEEAKGKAHHYYTKGSGRSGDALYAACIHVACRRAGEPRTFKELASATRDGAASRKDIGKLIGLIKKRLGEDEATGGGEAMMMDMGVVCASDYMRRFGSLLGLGEDEVRVVQEAAQRMHDKLDVRRNPDSKAAAIIYMAMERRPGVGRMSTREVSAATGVADNTIKLAYKELSPRAQMLFDD